MTFSWCDLLELAKELTNTPAGPLLEEARERCAVSRAYYAVFGFAKAHLKRTEPHIIFTQGPEDHRILMDKFSIRDRLVATTLDRLRRKRNNADYDYPFPGSLASVREDCIEKAEKAIERLRAKGAT